MKILRGQVDVFHLNGRSTLVLNLWSVVQSSLANYQSKWKVNHSFVWVYLFVCHFHLNLCGCVGWKKKQKVFPQESHELHKKRDGVRIIGRKYSLVTRGKIAWIAGEWEWDERGDALIRQSVRFQGWLNVWLVDAVVEVGVFIFSESCLTFDARRTYYGFMKADLKMWWVFNCTSWLEYVILHEYSLSSGQLKVAYWMWMMMIGKWVIWGFRMFEQPWSKNWLKSLQITLNSVWATFFMQKTPKLKPSSSKTISGTLPNNQCPQIANNWLNQSK